jgi:hypothetical protein
MAFGIEAREGLFGQVKPPQQPPARRKQAKRNQQPLIGRNVPPHGIVTTRDLTCVR